MPQENERSPFRDLDSRVRELRSRMGARRERGEDLGDSRPIGYGSGVQVGIELVGGVLGGLLIGYLLDRVFGSGPVLLIVFFFLGAAAGMLNAYRFIRRMSAE